MSNNSILNNEILSYIENIDNVTLESEMNVLTSLCDVYEKTCTIMEHYEGDALSDFDIFQEGFLKDSVDATNKKLQGKNIIVKILKFIPTLIGQMLKQLTRVFNKTRTNSIIDDLNYITNTPKKERIAAYNKYINNKTNGTFTEAAVKSWAREITGETKKVKTSNPVTMGNLSKQDQDECIRDIMAGLITTSFDHHGLNKMLMLFTETFQRCSNIIHQESIKNDTIDRLIQLVENSFTKLGIKEHEYEKIKMTKQVGVKEYSIDDISQLLNNTSDIHRNFNNVSTVLITKLEKYLKILNDGQNLDDDNVKYMNRRVNVLLDKFYRLQKIFMDFTKQAENSYNHLNKIIKKARSIIENYEKEKEGAVL